MASLRLLDHQLLLIRAKKFSGLFRNCLAALACVALLVACASSGRVVNHAFGFDVRGAVPAVEVLNYRYGVSGLAHMPDWIMKKGSSVGTSGVRGDMTVGDFLYVKWRIKESGEVFEETVDLRSRLPRDMKDRSVCLYIVGKQLYVYLVDFDTRPIGSPRLIAPGSPIDNLPFTILSNYRIIYPDQAKP